MDAVPPWQPHNTPGVLLQLCELQLLASMSFHPIKIQKIHVKDHNPSLRDFVASVTRLVDTTIIGSRIEINQIRVTFYYKRGLCTVGL